MAIKRQQHATSTESDAPLSTLVVRAVSAATETPPDKLPPLYQAIDPDALDVVFDHSDTEGAVEFQYAGRTVTVFADRTVNVSLAAPQQNQP
jgi:hypothetical protein